MRLQRPRFVLPAVLLAAGSAFAQSLHVTLHNPLAIARSPETIELSAASLKPLADDLARVHVFDGDREVLAQALDLDGDGAFESLIFQAEMPASGKRAFELRVGEKRVYRKEDFRVYGRFVRERFDDFAWENDRIAHRTYGAALETWQKEPLTSSAIDVWLKRTKRLVINDWYMTDDYHRDTGEGADFYSAGKSRGCGGSGLWRDGKLIVSKNFRDSRVLANGPIRLVFELVYPDSGTKRVTLDAGQNFSRYENRYDDANGAMFAVGIRKQPVMSVRAERDAGWLRTWEPVKDDQGNMGCAIVVDAASIENIAEADGNHVVVLSANRPYYAGAAWDRSGDFKSLEDWDQYVANWAARVKTPVTTEVTQK